MGGRPFIGAAAARVGRGAAERRRPGPARSAPRRARRPLAGGRTHRHFGAASEVRGMIKVGSCVGCLISFRVVKVRRCRRGGRRGCKDDLGSGGSPS